MLPVRTYLHLHLHLLIHGGAVVALALSLLGWLTLRSLKGMGRRDHCHGGVLTVVMMRELGRLQTVVRGCGGG